MRALHQPKAGTSILILMLRVILGYVFFYHGAQKVLGWFGGPGLEGFVGYMTEGGMPAIIAYLVGFGEFLGGIGLIIGLLTKPAALGMAIIMAGATFIVHWSAGFSAQNGGYEYPLTLLIISIVVFLYGGGDYSVDKKVFDK